MRQAYKSIASLIGGVAAVAGAVHFALRKSRRMQLNGRVVVITGGSRGLGLVLAREFRECGARVALCARN